MYEFAGEHYKTKSAIEKRCRCLLYADALSEKDTTFLISLFKHHDEWNEKSMNGPCTITRLNECYSTRCFGVIRSDGSIIDISFLHAIKCLGSNRGWPQPFLNFKQAARNVIDDQIISYKDATGGFGEHVDHVYPITFDRLLYEFCIMQQINPLNITVVERRFKDKLLEKEWREYHKKHAVLRRLTATENLRQPKWINDWNAILTKNTP